METNTINKELYESAFIENGEYGYHGRHWNPSIDENQISEWAGDDEGNYMPATPLGYRDYQISRIEGIKNILSQPTYVDLTEDRLHHVKKDEGIIKLYDKIKADQGEFVVCGESEDHWYVVNSENRVYYIEYEK